MGGMPVTATWDQDSFRWYTDAGGEGTNPLAAANTNPTGQATATQYRLRYLIQETAGSTSSETPTFQLEFRHDPAGGTSFGAWTVADSDLSQFTAVASASVTDGGATTQQIGAGTFNDGDFVYVDAGGSATGAMAATAGNDEYECEWVINIASGGSYEFRVVVTPGSALDTVTNTTQVTFTAPPVTHTASGGLVAGTATVAGSASRTTPAVTHTASGALSAGTATVTGSANRFREHSASGALSAGAASVTGSANRFREFSASGSLVGQGASVVGVADRFREFTASGVLVAGAATVTGSASRTGAPVTHTASGNLVAGAATITGSANRFRAFSASGVLVGQGSAVTASANRFREFSASGTLTAGTATVTGAASRSSSSVTHTASGTLSAGSATITATSTRYREFSASGSLVGSGAAVTGSATNGILAGAEYVQDRFETFILERDGDGIRIRSTPVLHGASGSLIGAGAAIVGAASVSVAVRLPAPEDRTVYTSTGLRRQQVSFGARETEVNSGTRFVTVSFGSRVIKKGD